MKWNDIFTGCVAVIVIGSLAFCIKKLRQEVIVHCFELGLLFIVYTVQRDIFVQRVEQMPRVFNLWNSYHAVWRVPVQSCLQRHKLGKLNRFRSFAEDHERRKKKTNIITVTMLTLVLIKIIKTGLLTSQRILIFNIRGVTEWLWSKGCKKMKKFKIWFWCGARPWGENHFGSREHLRQCQKLRKTI